MGDHVEHYPHWLVNDLNYNAIERPVITCVAKWRNLVKESSRAYLDALVSQLSIQLKRRLQSTLSQFDFIQNLCRFVSTLYYFLTTVQVGIKVEILTYLLMRFRIVLKSMFSPVPPGSRSFLIRARSCSGLTLACFYIFSALHDFRTVSFSTGEVPYCFWTT